MVSCLKRMQLDHVTFLGPHGYATLVVAVELEKRFVGDQRGRQEHEFERHHEDNSALQRSLRWFRWWPLREREKDTGHYDCSVCDDAEYSRGSFLGRSPLVDLFLRENFTV